MSGNKKVLKQKERLEGQIKFRVTLETEDGFKLLRDHKFNIQEILRAHAEEVIEREVESLKKRA